MAVFEGQLEAGKGVEKGEEEATKMRTQSRGSYNEVAPSKMGTACILHGGQATERTGTTKKGHKGAQSFKEVAPSY
jgi:hypothetical protein